MADHWLCWEWDFLALIRQGIGWVTLERAWFAAEAPGANLMGPALQKRRRPTAPEPPHRHDAAGHERHSPDGTE
jgi:hypothetical protein